MKNNKFTQLKGSTLKILEKAVIPMKKDKLTPHNKVFRSLFRGIEILYKSIIPIAPVIKTAKVEYFR